MRDLIDLIGILGAALVCVGLAYLAGDTCVTAACVLCGVLCLVAFLLLATDRRLP